MSVSLADWLRERGAAQDVLDWAHTFGTDWERAWTTCPRGDWLLAIAARRRVSPVEIVRAAHACADFALEYVPDDEARVREAHHVTEAWLAGQDDPALRARAGEACERAVDEAPDRAAQCAAIAVLAALRAIDEPDDAASAAAAAMQAAAMDAGDCAMLSAMAYAASTCADRVREHVALGSIVG